jgi:hypothetical protein
LSEGKRSLVESFQAIKLKRKKEIEDSLFHYTNENGLYGILSSQSLWATHYSFLNDRKEFWHYIEEQGKNIAFKQRLIGLGNAIRGLSAEKSEINEINFPEFQQRCKDVVECYAPFIFSFCSVEEDEEQTFANGDLIMWRAYSQKGGYAIRFSKVGLTDLLEHESQNFDYLVAPASPSRVKYTLEETVKDELYQELINASQDDEQKNRPLIIAFEQACLHKHVAFKLEREHRMFCFASVGRDEETEKPMKKILFRTADNIPYVELNEKVNNANKNLPINSIIVGPSRDQEERVSKLKIWLKATHLNIPVHASNIPFVC